MQAPPTYAQAVSLPVGFTIPHLDPSAAPASPPSYTQFAPIPTPARPPTPPLPSPVRIDIQPTTFTPPNHSADRAEVDYSDWKCMCKCFGYTLLFILIVAASILEILFDT